MFTFVLAFTVACSSGTAPAPTTTSAAPKVAAPVAAVVVGPEGPTKIAIPAMDAVSTDPAVVTAGTKVFTDRGCGGCHKFGEKLVGPDLKGVFSRRQIPWVERMIMDPAVMVKEDPQAKELFRSLMVEMPKQGVPPEDLPALLAYLKSQGG